MTFIECIIAAAESDSGINSKKIIDDYNSKVSNLKETGIDDAEARRLATEQLSEEFNDTISARRDDIENAAKFKELVTNINRISKELKIDKAEATNLYLETVYAAIHGEQHKVIQNLGDVSNELKLNWAGTRDKALLDRVGEMLLSGKFDGSPAGLVAKALRQMETLSVLEYMNAGGRMSPRKNFIPEAHSPYKIRKAGKKAWTEKISKTHDVYSESTGKIVTDPVEKQKILDKAYDRITTHGRSDRDSLVLSGEFPPGPGKRRYGSGRRNYRKVLYAKDYTSWVEYNSLYGRASSVVDAMILNSMNLAKETAVLKNLGTDPNKVKFALKDIMQSTGKFRAGAMLDSKFQVLTGEGLFGREDAWSVFLANTSSLLRSSTLGMAGFSALPDTVFVRSTALANGLSATRVMRNYFKFMAGAGKEGKTLARRTGFISDSIIGTLHLAERDSQGFRRISGAQDATSALANITSKLSGLSHITNVGRMTMHLESMATALENMNVRWADLDANLRESFVKAGIGEEDWVSLNNIKPEEIGLFAADGATGIVDTAKMRSISTSDRVIEVDKALENSIDKYVEAYRKYQDNVNPNTRDTPSDRARNGNATKAKNKAKKVAEGLGLSDQELDNLIRKKMRGESLSGLEQGNNLYSIADKLDSWSASLQQIATNEGNLTSKAITQGDFLTSRKTLKVAFGMYKTFPLSVLFNHSIPAVKNVFRGKKNSLSVLAHTFVYSTLLGYVSLSAKDILSGKTPKDPKDPHTWLLSGLAGGGGGLIGDVFNPRYSRFGSSTADMLMGPPAQLGFDLIDGTKDALSSFYPLLYEGDTDKFYKKVDKALKKGEKAIGSLVPLKNIWFGRLLIDRIITDAYRRWRDENYDESNSKYMKSIEESGQEFWYPPGGEPDLEKLQNSLTGGK